MGAGRVAGDGNFADRSARVVFRDFATGVRVRLPAGGDCVLGGASVLRLARPLHCRRAPRLSCAVHPDARAGVARLVAPAVRDSGFLDAAADRAQTPLGAFSLCHSANDSVQRDVAWDAGHVSNFSRRTTSLRRHTKGGDRDHFRGVSAQPDYAKALAVFTFVIFLILMLLAAIGPEKRGKEF